MDPYFNRPEVSNSDLSALKEYLHPTERPDPTEAYKFGTLIDMMITEPDKVDYFRLTCDGVQYSPEQFEQAKAMKKAFMADAMCKHLLEKSVPQKVMIQKDFRIQSGTFHFTLDARCKWDLWSDLLGWGGDIKSTAATTQKQCEEAARFFDYPRSRAWYMDIAGSEKDILLFISKVNFKVFKIPIRRGDDFYNEGKAQYQELALKYWTLFL